MEDPTFPTLNEDNIEETIAQTVDSVVAEVPSLDKSQARMAVIGLIAFAPHSKETVERYRRELELKNAFNLGLDHLGHGKSKPITIRVVGDTDELATNPIDLYDYHQVCFPDLRKEDATKIFELMKENVFMERIFEINTGTNERIDTGMALVRQETSDLIHQFIQRVSK
jgi:hypothetical protein